MSQTMQCKGWAQEAALRCLRNNLHPDVAERPEDLVVYGGNGKAARDHASLEAIERTLMRLEDDETLMVQSGKPVAVFRTFPHAPRVLIANSLLVPGWATWPDFWELEALGLTMYGQMTAGSWIYIGTQGIVQGTFQTFAALAEQRYDGTLRSRIVLTAGLGGMGGAQPLAVTLNGGVALCLDVDPARVQKRIETRYLDEVADSLSAGLRRAREAARLGQALSIGVVANAAEALPALLAAGEQFDVVTDQTSAHDPLHGYVPAGLSVQEAAALSKAKPQEYVERARASMVEHCRAMVGFAKAGAEVFDYGNNLRGEAREAGLAEAFHYPGFVPAYIRPLFCQGIGRSGSWRCRATRTTSPSPTRRCCGSSRTTPTSSGGSRWPGTGSPSRGCPPGSAGSGTESGPARALSSTTSSPAARSPPRW